MKEIKKHIEEINGPATVQFTCRPESSKIDLQFNINLYDDIWQDLSDDIKWHSNVDMSFPITISGKKIKIVVVVKEGKDWGRAYILQHDCVKTIWV